MSDDDLTEFNTGESLDVVVPGSLRGVRVDRAIAMLTGLSRNDVTKLINDGRVTLDGRVVVKSSVALSENQRLFAALPEDDDGMVRPDASVPVDLVLEDEHFVVVNKAADQVVHPARDAVRVRWSPESPLAIPKSCNSRSTESVSHFAPESSIASTKERRVCWSLREPQRVFILSRNSWLTDRWVAATSVSLKVM